MARTYPVKKGVSVSPEALLQRAKELTGNGSDENGHIVCTIPGLKRIEMYQDGKNLLVETETDPNNPAPMETIRQFNNLIEAVTGFSSKERKKRFSKT